MVANIKRQLEEKKAEDLLDVDVKDRCSFTDILIVATGNSARQLQALCDAVCDIKRPTQIEGYQKGEWILIDYGSIIVHLFQPHMRKLYSLEQLWSVDGGWDNVETLTDETESPLERKIRELRKNLTSQRGPQPL